MSDNAIYARTFVEDLFEEMSPSYWMSGLLSFGALSILRRKAVARLSLANGMTVYDLMSGTGECWRDILHAIGASGHLIGVDFSTRMQSLAQERSHALGKHNISLTREDVLSCTFQRNADAVICAYGVKTLHPHDFPRFVDQLTKALKPGGTFAILELRKPCVGAARRAYNLYAGCVVPRLLRILGYKGEPYRQLPAYLARQDEGLLLHTLRSAGFEVRRQNALLGLAVIIWGSRPVKVRVND